MNTVIKRIGRILYDCYSPLHTNVVPKSCLNTQTGQDDVHG